MTLSLLHLPAEVLQHIAFYVTLVTPLGPPKELINCMLTCRTLNNVLSPPVAGELYYLIFAHKFDVRAPQYRLGADVVREHAHAEMRRRFLAIQLFKSQPSLPAMQSSANASGGTVTQLTSMNLTEALWIAYVMVEDADTKQKNVKQLLNVGLPAFLAGYLRERLYVPYDPSSKGVVADGDESLWPVLDETISLATALAWTLASQG